MTAPTLAVPIDLKALCVSPTDDTSSFGRFENQFEALPFTDPHNDIGPALAADVVPNPFDHVSSSRQLKAGVHIHWALPDALSHGHTKGQSRVAFPEAPNRWLIVRNVVSSAQSSIASSAWVLESDHLWEDPPYGVSSDDGKDRNINSSYVLDLKRFETGGVKAALRQGRVFAAQGWAEDATALRVQQHNVTGYGVPEFAAVYSHSRNVFGFWDTSFELSQVMQQDASAQLSYTVIGWYSDPSKDPLVNLAANLPVGVPVGPAYVQALATTYDWSVAVPDAGNLPAQTLFHGMISNVAWSATGTFIKTITPQAPTVAMGNTTAQAMAAYVAHQSDFKTDAGFETLLDVLQLNQLPQGTSANGYSQMDEARHQAMFQSFKGGTVWNVQPSAAVGQVPGTIRTEDLANAASTVMGLMSPEASDALDALNVAQARFDRTDRKTTALRSQLFADWHKVMFAVHPDPDNPVPVTGQPAMDFFSWCINGPLTSALADRDAQRTIRDGLYDQAQAALPTGYTLASGISDPFWQANDPVLVVADPLLQASPRWGGDGRFDVNGLLACRLSNNLLSSIAYQGSSAALSARALSAALAVPATLGFAQTLVDESLLLDPLVAPLIVQHVRALAPAGNTLPDASTMLAAVRSAQTAAYNVPTAAAQAAQAAQALDRVAPVMAPTPSPIAWTGALPSPVALEVWAQPFLPVTLQWSASYWPDRAVTCVTQEALDPPFTAYGSDFVTRGYELSPHDTELVPLNAGVYQANGNYLHTFSGSATLSQRPDAQFKARVKDFLAAHQGQTPPPDPMLAKALGESFPVVAQALHGLNHQLLMREAVLQVPVADPLSGPTTPGQGFVSTAAHAIADQRSLAPLPLSLSLNGIRSGYFQLNQVRVLDAFGQVLDFSNVAPIYTETLPAAQAPNQTPCVKLPPRMTQPSRVNLRWRSALDGSQETNSSPLTSPIFGWVLYNHIDDALAIYSANGLPVGSFQVQGKFWKDAPLQKVFRLDPNLVQFCEGLRQASDQVAYLEGLLDCIDKVCQTFASPRLHQDNAQAVLMSRPLALVRATLDLELYGPPALNQRWEAFAEQTTPPSLPLDGATPSRPPRFTGGFEAVKFPIEIGDVSDPDDSVVGFFVTSGANGQTSDYQTFYSSVAKAGAPGMQASTTLTRSFTDNALNLTVLMDPRGSLGTTTGILPVKTLTIPTNHYSQALKNLSFTMSTFPLLSAADRLACPLPTEAGKTWSFIRQDPSWTLAPVKNTDPSAALNQYPLSLVEGWLKLTPNAS